VTDAERPGLVTRSLMSCRCCCPPQFRARARRQGDPGTRLNNWSRTARVLVGHTALAALSILPVGAARCADDPLSIPTVTVSYADLDLSKAEGVRTLYQRIVAAAQQVCASAERDAPAATSRERCAAEAVSRAVTRVGLLALTRYALAQSGVQSSDPGASAADR
jgi:UrcA family protein